MKRLFLAVLLPLLTVSACRPSGTELAIRQQLIDFPESHAQDFYKSFCQDNLGPEHLIPDPSSAAMYLQEELRTYQEDLDSARYDAPELQYYPVGDEGNYVRVDLSVILDSLVEEKAFLDAFVRSANEGKKASEEEWVQKWQQVARMLAPQRRFPGRLPPPLPDHRPGHLQHRTQAADRQELILRLNPPAFRKGGGFYNNKRNTINF